MNILFVFNSFPGIGGVESVSNCLMDYLGKYHTIYSVSLTGDSSAPASARLSDSFRFPSVDNSTNIEFFNSLTGRLDIDCVINQGLYPELSGIVFNDDRKRGMKIISVLHGMPGYEKRQFWLLDRMRNASGYKKAERRFLACIGLNHRYNEYIGRYKAACVKAVYEGDRVVLLTDMYRDMFIKEYGIRRYQDKICHIENPLPARYSGLKEPAWELKENNVLYVGRLSAEKRVDIILELWKNVSRPDWYLYIVGDGPEMGYLKSMGAGLGNVVFTGYAKDPSEYYARSKILLLTSEFEGFGMCLIEAQRFGVVPVAYNVSAGVSSILEGGGGVAVEKNDFKSLCHSVESLMNDRPGLERMAAMAYGRSRRYELDRIGGQWLNMIENMA